MASSKSQKLEDQAATAALYVTRNQGKSKDTSSSYPLDKDGKLSSAGAATSLKHATPKDLPSYPTVGLAKPESASGAAASLANSHPTKIEFWQPGEIPAANKAALLAKDTKPPELWHPELSAAGSKAALQAQKEGANVNIWRPEDTDVGQSAAGQAMRKNRLSAQGGETESTEGNRKALLAATGAMSGSRRRADSTPTATPAYPDATNSQKNALKAANSVSKASKRSPEPQRAPPSPKIDAGRIHNQAITNLSREMYTANPPVAPEVEERKKQEGLRAAAVSMAKRMYDIQQKQMEEASQMARSDSHYAASTVHNRPTSSASSDDSYQKPQYTNLQEAAQRLAAERLAKLHDEHAAYRTYYGTQAVPHSRKLSVRGRARRRASSEGDDEDEERARQVRNQMSLFTDKLAQVDGKKRQQDRDTLLAAAQRNVRASMQGMDEKVFNETGKVTPAMMEEWETKAKAKAQAESETRMVNHGRVHIGAGKFLDQSEVDAIAAAKVQPTLDEITETAENQRARDEELRQLQLERERLAAEKAADDKERAQKTKEEWKRFKEEEKREKQAKKDEERAKKAEEKRKREEEKQKAKEEKTSIMAPVVAPVVVPDASEPQVPHEAEQTTTEEEGKPSTEAPKSEETEPDTEELERFNTAETGEAPSTDKAAEPEEPVADTEETSVDKTAAAEAMIGTEGPGIKHETPVSSRIALPAAASTSPPVIPAATIETTVSGPGKSPKEKDSGKVSSWLKNKFRRNSKPTKPEIPPISAPIPMTADPEKTTLSTNTDGSGPAASSDLGDQSMREVAIAGKDFGAGDSSNPNPLSSNPATSSLAAPPLLPEKTKYQTEQDAAAGLYDNDGEAEGEGEEDGSTSPVEISSLSSDEDTRSRGRSAIRLADEMNLPTNEAAQQPVDKRAGMVVGDLPPTSIPAAATSAVTDSGAANAEAKTEVEKQNEKVKGAEGEEEGEDLGDLPPPPAAVPAAQAEGRVSGSPARDSRFVEEL